MHNITQPTNSIYLSTNERLQNHRLPVLRKASLRYVLFYGNLPVVHLLKKMNNVLYWLTSFIVLAGCNSTKQEISQVDFRAGACFGECPIFTMSITGDGAANFHAEMFNKVDGNFKTVIRKPQLDSLMTLVNKSNFFSLENHYTNAWTDHATYTLTVRLQNGQTKTIEDYGPSGPEKLKRVYEFIFSLRESQNWK